MVDYLTAQEIKMLGWRKPREKKRKWWRKEPVTFARRLRDKTTVTYYSVDPRHFFHPEVTAKLGWDRHWKKRFFQDPQVIYDLRALRGHSTDKGRFPLLSVAPVPLGYHLYWYRDYPLFLLGLASGPCLFLGPAPGQALQKKRGMPHSYMVESLASFFLPNLLSQVHLFPFLFLRHFSSHPRIPPFLQGFYVSLDMDPGSGLPSLWEKYSFFLRTQSAHCLEIQCFWDWLARLLYSFQAEVASLAHLASIHRSLLPSLCQELAIPWTISRRSKSQSRRFPPDPELSSEGEISFSKKFLVSDLSAPPPEKY